MKERNTRRKKENVKYKERRRETIKEKKKERNCQKL